MIFLIKIILFLTFNLLGFSRLWAAADSPLNSPYKSKLRSPASRVSAFRHPLMISVMGLKSFTSSEFLTQEQPMGYGISSEFLYYRSQRFLASLKAEWQEERSGTNEGGFKIQTRRQTGLVWGVFSSDQSNWCQCSLGLGLGVGGSQTHVNSEINQESQVSLGVPEPIWGLMLDVKLMVFNPFFLQLSFRKLESNNFAQGQRFEINGAVGWSFF